MAKAKKKKTTKKSSTKAAPSRAKKKSASKRQAAKKKTASKKKTSSKKAATSKGGGSMTPKAKAAAQKAAEALWGVGVAPHTLLQEVHELLLLRCLQEAEGNYAAAATLFGPSRQSVQQYANSPLRDSRWRPFQQNKRRSRAD